MYPRAFELPSDLITVLTVTDENSGEAASIQSEKTLKPHIFILLANHEDEGRLYPRNQKNPCFRSGQFYYL